MKGLHELDSIIRLVEPIASVSVCIACLELLARPGTIDDCGLMNWPTAKLRFRWFATGPIAGLLDVLLSYPTILIIITARLLAAATLLTGLPHGALRTVLATVVATVSIAMGLRSPYGQDGADQMTLLTFGGLALVHVSGGVAGRTFLWFMAAQTCLSYATAGLAKLGSAGWRDGSHLIRIFNTQIYGHARLATQLAARPVLARLLARSIILAESSFPLMLIAPRPLAILLLLSGIAFHVTAAIAMGLNTFLWSFLATYPALVYCSRMG